MDRHYIKKHLEGTKAAIVLLLLIVLAFQPGQTARGQVTVGNNTKPAPRSLLEISTANTKGGLRLPQLTTKQRDDLTKTQDFVDEKTGAAVGLMIMNMDTRCVEYWSGSQWIARCGFDLPAIEAELESPPGPFCPDEPIGFIYTLGGVNGSGTLYVYEGGDGSVGSGTQLDIIPDLPDGQDVWYLPAEAANQGLRNPGGTYTIWFEVMHAYTGARIRAAAVQYTIKAAAEFTSPASNQVYTECSHASNTQTLSVAVTDPGGFGITGYKWYVGAANDTDPDEGTLLATHPKTTSADTYEAPLTDNDATRIYWCDVTNSCGTVTRCPYPFTITTYATPGTPDTPADASVCMNSLYTVNVTGLSGGKTPYTVEVWETGGSNPAGTQTGVTGTSANVQLTAKNTENTAATYYVKVTDDCGHTSQSQEFTLTTYNTLNTSFSYGSAATTTCTQDVEATATGGKAPYTYQWYWNTAGGNAAGTNEAPASPGTGNVTGTVGSHGTAGQSTYWYVVVTDACGNTATSTAQAMSLGTPTVSASGGSTTGRCSADLSVTASGAVPPYSVQWYQKNKTVDAGDPVADATAGATPMGTAGSIATQGGGHALNNAPSPASGSYYYFAVVTSACGVQYVSASQQVSAGSALAITVTGDGRTVCKNTTETVSYSLSGGVTNYKSVVLQKNANDGNANGAWSDVATENNPAAGTNTIGLTTENTDNVIKYYRLVLTDQCDQTKEQTFTLSTHSSVTEPGTNATSYTACPGTSLEITATNIGGGTSPYTVTVYNAGGTAITSASGVTASSRAISFNHGVAAGASANFTVGVKDACGNEVKSNNFTVTVAAAPTTLTLANIPSGQVCPGGSISIVPSVTGAQYPITFTLYKTATPGTTEGSLVRNAVNTTPITFNAPNTFETSTAYQVKATDACGRSVTSSNFTVATIPHLILARAARDWFANGSSNATVSCEVSAKYRYTLNSGASLSKIEWFDNAACTGTPLSSSATVTKYNAPCVNQTGFAVRELWAKITAVNNTCSISESIVVKAVAHYRAWADGSGFAWLHADGISIRMTRTNGANNANYGSEGNSACWLRENLLQNMQRSVLLLTPDQGITARVRPVVWNDTYDSNWSGSLIAVAGNGNGMIYFTKIGCGGCSNGATPTCPWVSPNTAGSWSEGKIGSLLTTNVLYHMVSKNPITQSLVTEWGLSPIEKIHAIIPMTVYEAVCNGTDAQRGWVNSAAIQNETVRSLQTLTRLGEP